MRRAAELRRVKLRGPIVHRTQMLHMPQIKAIRAIQIIPKRGDRQRLERGRITLRMRNQKSAALTMTQQYTARRSVRHLIVIEPANAVRLRFFIARQQQPTRRERIALGRAAWGDQHHMLAALHGGQ